jgi:hypothetical protein
MMPRLTILTTSLSVSGTEIGKRTIARLGLPAGA